MRVAFCLFISLVNPHDIGVYPGSWMKPFAHLTAPMRGLHGQQ
jgi:hypothetical protein